MRIRNAHLLTLKNLVMIDTIKNYAEELWANYVELRDAYGHFDSATQNAFREWMVMEELLTRLNLQNETI